MSPPFFCEVFMKNDWFDKDLIFNSSTESSVYIGCDSIRRKLFDDKWIAKYCVVAVLHFDSCRGAKIFHYSVTEQDFGNLYMRLLREVSLAVQAAEMIAPFLNGKNMEIHLDINPDKRYASSVAVKEALGWVAGQGFNAKIKPDGWAATHAADHMVKSLQN